VRSVPVIKVPADITVTEASPGAGAAVAFTVTADGTPVPTISCVEGATPVLSGDTFAAGVHTITCTATNTVGSDSDSFTITVRSVPVITVPADITATESPQGSGSAAVPFTVTATGVPTPTISCVEGATPVSSGDTFAIGTHTIDCTATNAVGSDSDSFDITVVPANHPPVPDAGGPYSVAEGGTLHLDAGGTTDADGDTLTYSWDVNGDGTFGDATGVSPSLTWAQLSALGINDGPASFQVKVRVSDGHVGGTIDSSAVTLTVSNTAPTGSISGPADATRATAANWTFSASDPSSADQAAGFDFAIDWGDGLTTGPVHSGSPLVWSHTYAHVGVYTVSMTATDKDGGTSTTATKTVTVAGFEVVSGPCGGTDLVIGGTSGNDRISVSSGKGSSTVKVSVNNHSLGTFTVGRVVVLGAGGDDTITFDSKLTIPHIAYGGDGNDSISGGNGQAIEIGGAGNDTISTGNGTDVLVGGAGADVLFGGNGNDLLIAGSSSFDNPTAAGEQFWCQVQSTWSQSGTTGSLFTSGVVKNVFDDGVVVTLHGELGADVFYLNFSGGGAIDISDATASEVKRDLS
jgi:PKD repeat protein